MKMALFQDANNAQKWAHKENMLFLWSTRASLWHMLWDLSLLLLYAWF
jgi:hypothetical protein